MGCGAGQQTIFRHDPVPIPQLTRTSSLPQVENSRKIRREPQVKNVRHCSLNHDIPWTRQRNRNSVQVNSRSGQPPSDAHYTKTTLAPRLASSSSRLSNCVTLPPAEIISRPKVPSNRRRVRDAIADREMKIPGCVKGHWCLDEDQRFRDLSNERNAFSWASLKDSDQDFRNSPISVISSEPKNRTIASHVATDETDMVIFQRISSRIRYGSDTIYSEVSLTSETGQDSACGGCSNESSDVDENRTNVGGIQPAALPCQRTETIPNEKGGAPVHPDDDSAFVTDVSSLEGAEAFNQGCAAASPSSAFMGSERGNETETTTTEGDEYSNDDESDEDSSCSVTSSTCSCDDCRNQEGDDTSEGEDEEEESCEGCEACKVEGVEPEPTTARALSPEVIIRNPDEQSVPPEENKEEKAEEELAKEVQAVAVGGEINLDQPSTSFLKPEFDPPNEVMHKSEESIDLDEIAATYRQLSEEEFVARLSIHEAAKCGDLHVVKLLLRNDKKRMETVDERGWTPIHLSAANGHSEVVRFLAVEGAHLAALDPSGYTGLHLAAMSGFTESVEVFLEMGLDVDSVTADGFTPLHLAALNDYADCCKVLLSWGASMNKKDALGRTVQDMAVEYSLDEVSKLVQSFQKHLESFQKILRTLSNKRKPSNSKIPREILSMITSVATEDSN